MSNCRVFEAGGQTVLPDRSIWIGQKLAGNVKFKWDNLGNFQTVCSFVSLKNSWNQ